MEWVSESAAVRRHRVGGERRDGPAAAPQPEREARALETLVDARGGGGGSGSARTRKRSGAGSGGASGAARTGLSEARAALGLALYLLALRTLVQLSLQQLVLHGAPGHPREFNARQARYWPPSRPRVPSRPLPARGHRTWGTHPCGTARARRRHLTPRGVGWGALARPSPGDPIYRTRGWLALPAAKLVVQVGVAEGTAPACLSLSAPPADVLLVSRPSSPGAAFTFYKPFCFPNEMQERDICVPGRFCKFGSWGGMGRGSCSQWSNFLRVTVLTSASYGGSAWKTTYTSQFYNFRSSQIPGGYSWVPGV